MMKIKIAQKPAALDVLILSLFTVLITWQPYFTHHEIIMMETGIHLPALNALFHGDIPYRDFYFLRGPLELYVPALMMIVAGKNSVLLPYFYYGGTVLTLLFCVLLAQRVFKSRLVLYLMIPVLVARTFPRVSYYYWGGLRYAIGFLALWCLIMFFQKQKRRWIFLTGIISGFSFLTSIESGACIIPAVIAALGFSYIFKIQERQFILQSALCYGLGFLSVVAPYTMYLAATNSLIPFIESIYVVVNFNHVAYPGAPGVRPETFLEFLAALNPNSGYFKFMTPVFCYVAFAAFLLHRICKGQLNTKHAFLAGLTVYGLVLYAAAFRKIEGHHFEMALQAEKFLLFFMLEEGLFFLKSFKQEKRRVLLTNFLIFCFIGSSIGYAIQRYNHRFVMFKLLRKHVFNHQVKGLSWLENQETKPLLIPRGRGHIVPSWQADEIKGVVEFLETNTEKGETVFCYPEVGNFNFWADRPFVGRFPIATFTWMYEPWHEELIADFKKVNPEYVVMTKRGHRTFPHEWYFRNKNNIKRFDMVTKMILDNYRLVKSFSSVEVYQAQPSRKRR